MLSFLLLLGTLFFLSSLTPPLPSPPFPHKNHQLFHSSKVVVVEQRNAGPNMLRISFLLTPVPFSFLIHPLERLPDPKHVGQIPSIVSCCKPDYRGLGYGLRT